MTFTGCWLGAAERTKKFFFFYPVNQYGLETFRNRHRRTILCICTGIITAARRKAVRTVLETLSGSRTPHVRNEKNWCATTLQRYRTDGNTHNGRVICLREALRRARMKKMYEAALFVFITEFQAVPRRRLRGVFVTAYEKEWGERSGK